MARAFLAEVVARMSGRDGGTQIEIKGDRVERMITPAR